MHLAHLLNRCAAAEKNKKTNVLYKLKVNSGVITFISSTKKYWFAENKFTVINNLNTNTELFFFLHKHIVKTVQIILI